MSTLQTISPLAIGQIEIDRHSSLSLSLSLSSHRRERDEQIVVHHHHHHHHLLFTCYRRQTFIFSNLINAERLINHLFLFSH